MDKSPEAFRTISEVADWLGTPAHVLRFWESKFSQVKPIKRAGGRRYYRPSDMALLGGLKKLLHEDGMSIKGAQALIREQGVKHVAALSPPIDDHAAPDETVIELTAEAAPEVPPERPRTISGLPPLMLRTAAEDREEEPEEPEATAEEEHEREPELPFLHRRLDEHPTQPDREPLLRAAPEALDAHAAAPADETPPPGPEPITLPRLAELRAAALASGLGDELRARLLERLGELRDRMSENRAS